MILNNKHNIPLYAAVWLLQDDYDYVSNPKYISATTLLKSTKEIILTRRVDFDSIEMDISELVSRRLGSSIHDSVEQSWIQPERLSRALKAMGYSEEDIKEVQVNPTKADPSKPVVYLEQRASRQLLGYTIGGKYDFIMNGVLHDLKSTSVFSYTKGTKDEDYALQGSIYRWLNPDKITEDSIRITFLFKDWSAAQAVRDPNYPKASIVTKDIPLLSELETERFIRNKIQEIEKYKDSSEEDIPACTDKELWMKPSVFKYYSKPPVEGSRATKNFNNPVEAYTYMKSKGVGVVIEQSEPPAKCRYCSAFPICKQGQSYYEQ